MADADAPRTNDVGVQEAFAQIEAPDTGTDTFARYRWQTKQTVRHWLDTLRAGGPEWVVCEHVEDIAIVFRERVCLLQLKTRDRGSWNPTDMCKKGVVSLARSYHHMRRRGIHQDTEFELHLEGPIGESPETEEFTRDPRTATSGIRSRIMNAAGIDDVRLSDFLARLRIRPNQTPRADMDSTLLNTISLLWPGLNGPELRKLVRDLLEEATRAQGNGKGQGRSPTAVTTIWEDLPDEVLTDRATVPATIRDKALTREALLEITPPLPGEPDSHLLERLNRDVGLSALELKLRRAGARTETIADVQGLRADTEILLQQMDQSDPEVAEQLGRVGDRVLRLARAIARTTSRQPGAVEGEAVVDALMTNLPGLDQCDPDRLFADAFRVLGYLAELSDQCKFAWRAP